MESMLLVLLKEFITIIKPNAILTLNALFSPFFNLNDLDKLPQNHTNLKFINRNIFDFYFFIYEIYQNNNFNYIHDYSDILYKLIFGDKKCYKIHQTLEFLSNCQICC